MPDFLTATRQVIAIRKTEITLPIAKMGATITPLAVGDDLALRTAVIHPQKYDLEITKLIFKHIEINNSENKLNFNDFIKKFSHFDKISALWGLYKATYQTIGKRDISCPKCENKIPVDISLDHLIQQDTYTIWDEEVPFNEYFYDIRVDFDDYVYVFRTVIPTMEKYNRLLSIVPPQELKDNMEKYDSVFTPAQNMTLMTQGIYLYHKNDMEKPIAFTTSLQEILMSLNQNIPEVVSDEFFEKYAERFNKYAPKFYTKIICPQCGNEFDYEVNLELEFLRRAVFGGRQG